METAFLPIAKDIQLDDVLQALSVTCDEDGILWRRDVTLRDLVCLVADEIEKRKVVCPQPI